MRPLYLRSWVLELNVDGWWWCRTRTQGCKIAKECILRNGQSLSEVKMGRDSPICERVHKNSVEYFKTTSLNVKLQRLCKSHNLQCVTSSKYSEKLEKSLRIRGKAEDLCWMPVVIGPSDDTASLIGIILSLTLLNGPRNTSRNHCR